MSYARWRVLERALRLNRPLPYSPAVAPLSIAIGLVALAAEPNAALCRAAF